MDDLIAFLRARLAEDEAIAAAINEHGEMPPSAPWSTYPHPPGPNDKHQDRDVIMVGAEEVDAGWMVCAVGQWPGARAIGEHIARHDPARVLREVEAKRRIVDACERRGLALSEINWVVRVLALPYADHADYRKEWRP